MTGRLIKILGLLQYAGVRSARMVFSSHAASTLAAFSVQVCMVRLLSVSDFGALAAAMALSAVVEGAILSRGSETALTLIAKHHDAPRTTMETLILQLMTIDFLWVLGCVFTYCVVLWISSVRIHYSPSLLFLLALATCAQFPWGTIKAALFILHPPELMAKVELKSTVLFVAASVAGIVLAGAPGFCIANAVAQGLKVLLGFRALRVFSLKHVKSLRASNAIVPSRELVVLGFMGSVRAALSQFVQQMDVIALSYLAPGVGVAHYRAAKTLAALPARATTPLWVLARRMMVSGSQTGSDRRLQTQFGLVALGLGIVGVVFVATATAYSVPILTFVFGVQYSGSAGAYAWLAPAAWVLLVMTGWSSFYSSVSPRKLAFIMIYGGQALLFLIFAAVLNLRTPEATAMLFAALQIMVSVWFWVTLVCQPLSNQTAALRGGAV